MANQRAPFDTRVEIVTPENIGFEYQLAGPFRRLPAYLVDVLVRSMILFGGLFALMLAFGVVGLPMLGLGIWLMLWFGMEWLYGGLFETYWNGQTPGKRVLRIRVISVDGQPIGGLQAVLRNILRAVDAMPILAGARFGMTYQLGLFATASNDRYQRLGDLACGTMVVVEESAARAGVVKVDDPDVLRLAAVLPPSFQPSPSLARTLSSYMLRRRSLSWARRYEIARYVAEPLCQRFGLPRETHPDQLVCAVYYHAFIAERVDELAAEAEAAPAADTGASPFAASAGR